MSAPLFSIGIPNYERPDTLREALHNIFAQTFQDFEVIVSDDSSNANIAAVISEFNDPRLRWVQQEKNIGAVANFNYVIHQSRGRYIVLHQNDDMLHPDFLLRAFNAFQESPRATVYAACVWRGNPEQGLRASTLTHLGTAAEILNGSPFEIDGSAIAVQLLVSFPITFPAIVIAANQWRAIGGYFSAHELGADQITLCRALIGTTLLYDTRIGGLYRTHTAQTSRTATKADKKHYHKLTLVQMISDLEQHGIAWQSLLRTHALRAASAAAIDMLKESIVFRADPRLIRLLANVLRKRQLLSRASHYFKLIKKIKLNGSAYLLHCLRSAP